jgi:hypothetical protein
MEEFFLSSGHNLKIKDLVSLFEKVYEKKIQIQFGAYPYRPRESLTPITHGLNLPNWKPKIDILKGLNAMKIS